ncbi:hypothetical protein GQX74_008310 [Glossina fuscipes]|nr:hypothetical protein GQX74_008310 [Glossina fuscipes]
MKCINMNTQLALPRPKFCLYKYLRFFSLHDDSFMATHMIDIIYRPYLFLKIGIIENSQEN